MDIEIKVNMGDLKNSIKDQLAKYELQFDSEVIDELNHYGLLLSILYAKGWVDLDDFRKIGDGILERLKFHLYTFNPDITFD